MIEERLNKLAHDPELGMGGPMPMATPDPAQHAGRLGRMADELAEHAHLLAQQAHATREIADALDDIPTPVAIGLLDRIKNLLNQCLTGRT